MLVLRKNLEHFLLKYNLPFVSLQNARNTNKTNQSMGVVNEKKVLTQSPQTETKPHRSNSPSNFLRKNKNKSSSTIKSTTKAPLKHVNKETTAENKQLPSLDRYIHYLKQILKEKSLQQKIEMPSLCQCNNLTTFLWETDWNTCANNCIFYKNPKGNYFYKLVFDLYSIECI